MLHCAQGLGQLGDQLLGHRRDRFAAPARLAACRTPKDGSVAHINHLKGHADRGFAINADPAAPLIDRAGDGKSDSIGCRPG